MRKLLLAIALLLGLTIPAQGQGNTVILLFPGVPSGSCAFVMLAIDEATGKLYDCDGGAWNEVGPGAAGATSWSSLTDPTASVDLLGNAVAEIMTWDFQANYTTELLFDLKTTTGTPSGGVLLNAQVHDADVTIFRAWDGTDGVQVTGAGALGIVGSGVITATLGDSATSFFSSGTLEVGIGGTGAAAFTLGSVVFAGASGVYTQDNANFFWNDSSNRLGVGTAFPSQTVELRSSSPIMRIRDTGNVATATAAFIEFGGTTAASFDRTGFVGDAQVGNTDILLQAEDSDLHLGDSSSPSVIVLTGGRVGIGTATPATSAKLELSSTTGAFLPTRLTTAQRDALTAVDGMILYNSTDAQTQSRVAGAWVDLGGTAGGAPSDATYITQTSNGTLSAEQALDALASGIMRVDTAAGVITSLTDSAGIAANISDERGTGVMQFSGQTFEIPILDSDAVPDTTGNVWSEPFTVAATNDNWRRMVWVFTDTGSARNCLHGGFLVPNDYQTGGTASFNVVWSSPVLTNDVEWDLDYRGIGGNDTESFDQATAVESLNANDTAPSAAWERMEIALGITEANLAPGDDVEFLLCRDMSDAGDTLVGDAYLFRLIFSYTN